MPYNTDWTGIPWVDERAYAIEYKTVKKARVICVSKASIRRAVIEKKYFEIADVTEPYSTYGDKKRVEVKCLWYTRKPKATWMHLTLLGRYREEADYTGNVVQNIGR